MCSIRLGESGARPWSELESVGPGAGPWLASLLHLWEASGHDLHALMGALRTQLDTLLPTLFHFGLNSLLILVDVRGFALEDIHVDAQERGVRLRVSHEEKRMDCRASRLLERTYELPRPVAAGQMVCHVRDGTLFVNIPWCFEQTSY